MKATVKIIGNKPIVFHKFNLEVITQMAKPKEGSAGNNPNEWKSSFWQENGRIFIPDHYIFSALKNGSVYTKVGRGSIQKSWVSAIVVETPKCFLNREIFADFEKISPEDIPQDSSKPVYVDIRMVANPNTKGRNVRYRLACSPGWETEFTISIDKTVVSQAQVKKVIEDTGKFIGLSDTRALGHGRFDVTSIKFED